MREIKVKAQTSEAKVVASVFWDSEGILLCYCNSWRDVPRSTHSGYVGIKVVETTNSKVSAK